MSGLDLLVDGFPHGTPDGYKAGCRGNVCPSKADNGFTCADAVMRYRGDWVFRKRVDQGMTPGEIAELDRAEAIAAAEAERAAIKAEKARRAAFAAEQKPRKEQKPRTVKRSPKPKRARVDERGRVRKSDRIYRRITDDEVTEFERLYAQGLDDSAIGREMDRRPNVIRQLRLRLELPSNTDRGVAKPIEHGTRSGYQRGCHSGCPVTPSCSDAEREYLREYRARRAAA